MKKKVLSLVIAASMVAAVFTGCGSSATSSAEEGTTSTSEAAEASTAEETDSEGAYKIALSNSYMENGWRQEMEIVAELVAESDEYKDLCTLDIYNTDNTAEAQAASIESLIPMGYDAIIIDCASDTGLNTAIDAAVDAGIVVVSFDSNCTTDKAYKVVLDSSTSYSFVAEYLSAAIGYKGNIAVDRGIANTTTSKGIYDAVMKVFDSYDGINVVAEFDGEFNEGTTQNAFSTVLSTNELDACFTQAYCSAIENACIDAGVDCLPSNGDAYMSNMKACIENNVPGVFVPWYVGCSAVALDAAIDILNGEDVEKEITLSIDPVITDDSFADMDELAEKCGVNYIMVEDGVNYSKDWPDQFLWPALPADFPVQISAEDVMNALNG